ncbi:hypothetical protein ACH427_03215 [Streptomyces sp. NPDC020379]|uniref:hypothetical protein n=1 Tax=Streptomyces sp. NPDC020379 TaxID=3365071 RepID=UPI0037A5718A
MGREPGQVTVYLVHHGGRRVVRHRADRVAIEYLILHPDRERAAGLAYLVRELLLEGMPGRSVPGALVLDVADVDTPKYLPDLISREHCYRAEVAITYIEEQPTA